MSASCSARCIAWFVRATKLYQLGMQPPWYQGEAALESKAIAGFAFSCSPMSVRGGGVHDSIPRALFDIPDALDVRCHLTKLDRARAVGVHYTNGMTDLSAAVHTLREGQRPNAKRNRSGPLTRYADVTKLGACLVQSQHSASWRGILCNCINRSGHAGRLPLLEIDCTVAVRVCRSERLDEVIITNGQTALLQTPATTRAPQNASSASSWRRNRFVARGDASGVASMLTASAPPQTAPSPSSSSANISAEICSSVHLGSGSGSSSGSGSGWGGGTCVSVASRRPQFDRGRVVQPCSTG